MITNTKRRYEKSSVLISSDIDQKLLSKPDRLNQYRCTMIFVFLTAENDLAKSMSLFLNFESTWERNWSMEREQLKQENGIVFYQLDGLKLTLKSAITINWGLLA